MNDFLDINLFVYSMFSCPRVGMQMLYYSDKKRLAKYGWNVYLYSHFIIHYEFNCISPKTVLCSTLLVIIISCPSSLSSKTMALRRTFNLNPGVLYCAIFLNRFISSTKQQSLLTLKTFYPLDSNLNHPWTLDKFYLLDNGFYPTDIVIKY